MDTYNNAGRVPVNKVIPLSTVDGPGARTAVFLQGCNIQCAYCHNPETQALCRHCGACVPGCPVGALALREGEVVWDHTKCVDCDKCIAACAYYASPKVRRMSAAAVMDEVRKSLPFVRGITVSGGECMLYPEFLLELFTLAKAEGLGCLIDSNGTVPFAAHEALLQMADGVMLDIKAWDADVYTALVERPDAQGEKAGAQSTGNSVVKDNLRLLAQRDKIEELRVVCLPGYMDPEAVLDGIATALGAEKTANVRLKLIRFRPNGVRGALAGQPATGDVEMQRLQNHAEIKGFTNIIVV